MFTHGSFYYYDSSGNGETGNWAIHPQNFEQVDKVIVYLRKDGENINHVYVGNFVGYEETQSEKQLFSVRTRYVISLSSLKEIGTTLLTGNSLVMEARVLYVL